MLDSKTRAKLRGLANQIEPTVMVGKEGITENVLAQIQNDLSSHELVKIAVMNNSDVVAKSICGELCGIVGAEPVQVIGRKIVIYKFSSKCKNHVL